eukprot:Filipodium_phascolosomae@DN7034_c0_g1_i1.p1
MITFDAELKLLIAAISEESQLIKDDAEVDSGDQDQASGSNEQTSTKKPSVDSSEWRDGEVIRPSSPSSGSPKSASGAASESGESEIDADEEGVSDHE